MKLLKYLFLSLSIFATFTGFSSCEKNNEIIDPKYDWHGKHIVWLGTSIPAGGGNIDSYPAYTAKQLNAIIHNESVGSSMIRVADYQGNWKGLLWANLALSLTQTIEEKHKIIDYFEFGLDEFGNIVKDGTHGWKDLCLNAPEFLTQADKDFIISCSYEVKLIQKYLDTNNPNFIAKPDLIVIDHGHNDMKEWYDDNKTNAIAVPVIRNDRNRFIGSVNYLIDIILKYNPDQKIAFIGHYESDRKQQVYLAQNTLFEYWSCFPSLKLWEELNWAQDIDPETGKTITQTMMPDDLHPYSDTRIDENSGFKVAIKTIGDCCYKFISNICM